MTQLIRARCRGGFWLTMVASAIPLCAAEPVSKTINLLDVIKRGDVEYHVDPAKDVHDDAKDIWKFHGKQLHISGRGYGYVATKERFRDYHLVVEFKWGEKTWGTREKAARDNGILLHGYGPHGAFQGTWMASVEAQIIEGGTGDMLVLSARAPDGTPLKTSVTVECRIEPTNKMIWAKGAPRKTIAGGRVNWEYRDPDWVDQKGFRGKRDVESAAGKWTRLEVIARGDTLQYFVNGVLVNEGFEVKPSEGRVLLQTEGAEMIVRRYELWPLDEFKEKWK